MIYIINGPQGRTDSSTYPYLCSEAHRLGQLIPADPLLAEALPIPSTDEEAIVPAQSASAPPFYRLRLIALGHPYAVDHCRKRLHKLGYAEINDWSIPLPIIHSTEVLRTADPGDIMRILTKRIAPPA